MLVVIFQIIIPLKTLLIDHCLLKKKKKVVINLMEVIPFVVFFDNASI